MTEFDIVVECRTGAAEIVSLDEENRPILSAEAMDRDWLDAELEEGVREALDLDFVGSDGNADWAELL